MRRRLLLAVALAVMALPLLADTSSAQDFSNTNPIVVPRPAPPAGCPPTCPPDRATLYPSNIAVAGMTGLVSDVNVTLHDLTYGRDNESGPPDLDIMLAAPNGSTIMLMSDNCGDNTTFNAIATPIDLTFDDQAESALPADTACSSGRFRVNDDDDDGEIIPIQFRAPDSFPDAPVPPGSTRTLAESFAGIDPNGEWRLYVVDDGPNTPGGNDGQIGGGWSLSITTATTVSTTAATTSTTASATSTTSTSTTTTSTTTTTVQSTTTTAGPLLRLSSTQVAAGERVTVAGDRLPASITLQINFLSAPVALGSVTTDRSGSFQTVVTVPANATTGAHQINVTDTTGRVLASVNVTVTRAAASGALARTGGATALGLALLAATAMLLGYFAITSYRNLGRRRPW